MIIKLLISLLLWVNISLAWDFALTPVMEWCEWEYSDNGSVMAIYHCVSPTWWDKLTNSSEWQRFDAGTFKEGKWVDGKS